MSICLMTNDVETTSIINGGLRVETGEIVAQEGMPALLDLYAKYDVKATFFILHVMQSVVLKSLRWLMMQGMKWLYMD